MSGLVRVSVNGEPTELPASATVADVVALLCRDDRGVAVAIDREVVPRSQWRATAVPEGAQVEIVGAAAGG